MPLNLHRKAMCVLRVRLQCTCTCAYLGEKRADDQGVAFRDADGVLIHQLVEARGDGAEVEGCQALAFGVGPNVLQGGHDGADVGAWVGTGGRARVGISCANGRMCCQEYQLLHPPPCCCAWRSRGPSRLTSGQGQRLQQQATQRRLASGQGQRLQQQATQPSTHLDPSPMHSHAIAPACTIPLPQSLRGSHLCCYQHTSSCPA